MSAILDFYLAEYQRVRSVLPGAVDSGAVRAGALDRLAERGFPTPSDERWRYTRLREFSTRHYAAGGGKGRGTTAVKVAEVLADLDPVSLVVLDNGAFRADLSRLDCLPDGVRVTPLATYLDEGGKLGRPAEAAGVFELLNTAFVRDGVLVEVSPGIRLVDPLYVVYVNGPALNLAAAHTRVLVHAAAGSAIDLVEWRVGDQGITYLSTAVTEIVAAERATVRHCTIQEEGNAASCLGHLNAHLARGAAVNSHYLGFGGHLARQEFRVPTFSQDAAVEFGGLLLAKGEQLQDVSVVVEHRALNTRSRIRFNGIVTDRARGVFNGRVHVHRGADGTDARMTNANLLLSAAAEVDTKPEFEIYADDVKCSHGASVGQLDLDAVFYLRSRGIPAARANHLLLDAFAQQIVAQIPIDVLGRRLASSLDSVLAGFGIVP